MTKIDAIFTPLRKGFQLSLFQKINRIIDEKKTLDALAQLEGFLPFEDCQIVSKDDGYGYDV